MGTFLSNNTFTFEATIPNNYEFYYLFLIKFTYLFVKL